VNFEVVAATKKKHAQMKRKLGTWDGSPERFMTWLKEKMNSAGTRRILHSIIHFP
jgi:hypothetical protein